MRLKLLSFLLFFCLFSHITAATIPQSQDGLETGNEDVARAVRSSTAAANKAKQQNYVYSVYPKSGTDAKERTKIETFFKDLKVLLGAPLVNSQKKILSWDTGDMTDAQLKKARAFGPIKGVEKIQTMEKSKDVITTAKKPSTRKREEDVDKREASNDATGYDQQLKAPDELAAISWPAHQHDDGLANFPNYVYKKGAGKGTFIYHIEFGVAYKKFPEEFAHVAEDFILTPNAKAANLKPNVDDGAADSQLHSTCTASKAVGQTLGSSKEATLVVVKMVKDTDKEMVAAVTEIAKDIKARPERQKKSVITMSMNALDMGAFALGDLEIVLSDLLELDVPMVVSSGNFAKEKGKDGKLRKNVDTYPSIIAGPNTPLIVVGAVRSNGQRLAGTQIGIDKDSFLYAVGADASCPISDGGSVRKASGTSIAAPIVAGQIANLLSETPMPFDVGGQGNLVRNLKEYLVSDKNSADRVFTKPVLWNGVTKEIYAAKNK